MRAIKVATREEAEALAARVDAAHGYPRCERLAGNTRAVGRGRHPADCVCRDVNAPGPTCIFATRGAPSEACRSVVGVPRRGRAARDDRRSQRGRDRERCNRGGLRACDYSGRRWCGAGRAYGRPVPE